VPTTRGLAERVDVNWLQPMHRAALLDRPDAIVVGASVGFPLNDGPRVWLWDGGPAVGRAFTSRHRAVRSGRAMAAVGRR
jgi:hypothetical protein